MVVGFWTLLLLTATWAIAGDLASSVFSTYAHAFFVLPIFLAAAMLGLLFTQPFVTRGLFVNSPWPDGYRLVVSLALGLGAFSLATLGLGAAHLLEPGGQIWPLLLLPVAAIAAGFGASRRFLALRDRGILGRKAHKGEWLLLAAAIPAAILLIAATFPPGTLWLTEARGYDVLEYHLQLPREYVLNNSTSPLAHNVYSFLPANVEMLYVVQMQFARIVLGGDRATGYVWGAFPAQMTHALLMLLTAAALALMPLGTREKPWLHATGRAIAVLLFLGTPWVLVTGSLAYNEGGMLLFGTLALGAALQGGKGAGLLAGILLGLAMGCKMTAGVFFAIPVALVFAIRGTTDGAQWKALLVAILSAVILYAPWAVRAAVASGGNPLFPVAASALGAGRWTPEQVDRFAKGHAAAAGMSFTERLGALADQSIYDGQWSMQMLKLLHEQEEAATRPDAAAPPVPDPWWRKLGTLWWGIPLALGCAFVYRQGRGEAGILLAILAVQLVAWMYATHLQARFLLPAAVPLALLAGRGVQGLQVSAEGIPVSAMRIIAGTVVVLHALFAGFLVWGEVSLRNGARPRAGDPARQSPIGDVLYPLQNVAASAEHASPGTDVTPQKTLLVGESRAWMFIGEVSYSTVFDGDLFVRQLADSKALAAWLREQQIVYVVINWREIARFRATYGFEGTLSVAEMKARVKSLAQAGIVHAEGNDDFEILRVNPAK
jgi:hypothetical protein